MTHASLFSGIGGAEVAAAWMGWRNVFHCEIQEFPRKVLDYWFPNAESYEDITKTDFTKWGGAKSMFSQEASPASLSASQVEERERKTTATSGKRCIGQSERLTPLGSLVKMLLESQRWWSPAKRLTWVARPTFSSRTTFIERKAGSPLSASAKTSKPKDTKSSRLLYQLVPSERRIWIIAHRTDPGAETMQQGGQDGVLPNGHAAHTDSHRHGERTDKQECIARSCGETNPRQGSENRAAPNANELGDFPHQESAGVEGSRSVRLPKQGERSEKTEWADGLPGVPRAPADTQCGGGNEIHPQVQPKQPKWEKPHGIGGERIDTDTSGKGLQGEHHHHDEKAQGAVHEMGRDAARFHNPIARGANRGFEGFPSVEPTIRRGNDGLSIWLDNLSVSFGKWRQQSIKAYGNAWVPQVAFEIFRAIETISKQQES